MFKKKFIGIVGLFSFVILFFPDIAGGDQYYDQYPGNGFVPCQETANYEKPAGSGFMYHNDTDAMFYYCPVNFNVPDGSNYFIKSLGIRYMDNLLDGQLEVVLSRLNLYTGNKHIVASWESGIPSFYGNVQTASQGSITGYKLIDTKKFVYWLEVYIFRGGVVNPGTDLRLYQVRIHYGT